MGCIWAWHIPQQAGRVPEDPGCEGTAKHLGPIPRGKNEHVQEHPLLQQEAICFPLPRCPRDLRPGAKTQVLPGRNANGGLEKA